MPYRRLCLYVLADIAGAPGLVALLKVLTARHCPWGIDRYGGQVPWTRLGDWGSARAVLSASGFHVAALALEPGAEFGLGEPDGLVLNGMSLSRRDSRWANSGLVVAIEPEDFARAVGAPL